MDESNALVPAGELLPKIQNRAAIARAKRISPGGYIPHLALEDIKALVQAVKNNSKPKHQDRNALLVRTAFDACLRCSEVLSIKPIDITRDESGCRVRVWGKGGKYREAAISPSLVDDIENYVYWAKVKKGSQIWPISRRRAHQMMADGLTAAGITKPDHVGAFHILRHSGAIERIKHTGNPKSVQDQLGHADAAMTLRYMKTLQHDESIKIQGEVDFW